MNLEQRGPGRPPTFGPEKKPGRDMHVRVPSEVWEAIEACREAQGEGSLSVVLRKLLQDRLAELGYLKRPMDRMSR